MCFFFLAVKRNQPTKLLFTTKTAEECEALQYKERQRNVCVRHVSAAAVPHTSSFIWRKIFVHPFEAYFLALPTICYQWHLSLVFFPFSLFLLYSLSLLFSFNLCYTFSLSALFTGVHFIVFTLYVFSSLCLVGLLSRSILIVCFTFTFLFCFAYSVFAHSIVRFLITTNKALCSFQQMFACRYVRACATRTVGLIWC